MGLRHLFKSVSVAEEREFERDNVLSKKGRYLSTNPMERFESDSGYREKVLRICEALQDQNIGREYILDLGGNTAGEATILANSGFHIIVGDINDTALDISQERVRKFGLESPEYVGLDAHRLPFADESVAAVTIIEALHHFPNPAQALAEVYRVLKPGGLLFSIEPYALNPIRRISEIRDRLRGTIEKSFTKRAVRRFLSRAGLTDQHVEVRPYERSAWKLEEVPRYRRPIWRLHGALAQLFPGIFGTLNILATKPGTRELSEAQLPPIADLFRSPVDGQRLELNGHLDGWSTPDRKQFYPIVNGIPVLIPGESRGQYCE